MKLIRKNILWFLIFSIVLFIPMNVNAKELNKYSIKVDNSIITIDNGKGKIVEKPYKEYIRYTTRQVNVRTGPSTSYKKVSSKPYNTKVIKVGTVGKYAIVKIKDKYYFIYNSYLSKNKIKIQIQPRTLKKSGVIRWGGYKWTWYTQRILPGPGMKIPGRHLDGNGFVCDKNNYIVIAAHKNTLRRGAIINTPFGKKAKVYDTGCSRGVIDVYTNW